MSKQEDFQKRIKAKINQVEAKLSYLRDGHNQLAQAFHEFAEEMDDYFDYQIKLNKSTDRRLKTLERK